MIKAVSFLKEINLKIKPVVRLIFQLFADLAYTTLVSLPLPDVLFVPNQLLSLIISQLTLVLIMIVSELFFAPCNMIYLGRMLVVIS